MQDINAIENKLKSTLKLNELYFENFIIVGLARNCGQTIKNDILKLHLAFRNFRNFKWLIIESDSDDNTLEVLSQIESEINGFRFISLGTLSKAIPLRTERIAYCRNKYLDEIKHNPLYENIKYIVVADLDGLNELLNEEALISCWLRNDWDVCTANQQGPYYDVYALRHPVWSPNDCMCAYDFYFKHNNDSIKSREIAIRSRMIKINVNADWIEVDSAFGGLAIYRKDAIGESYYIGVDNLGAEICEHVTFHKMLRENGKRIFINPKFINAAFTEHTIQLKLVNRVKDTITERLSFLVRCIRGR